MNRKCNFLFKFKRKLIDEFLYTSLRVIYTHYSMLVNLVIKTVFNLILCSKFVEVKLLLLLSCISSIKTRKNWREWARNKSKHYHTKYHQEYAKHSFKTRVGRHVSITNCCHCSHCKVKSMYIDIPRVTNTITRLIPTIAKLWLLIFSKNYPEESKNMVSEKELYHSHR